MVGAVGFNPKKRNDVKLLGIAYYVFMLISVVLCLLQVAPKWMLGVVLGCVVYHASSELIQRCKI